MGKLSIFFSSVLCLTIGLGIFRIYSILIYEPPLPEVKNEWWGEYNSKIDENVYPFRINISDTVLEDLRIRLKNTKSSFATLHNTFQTYGTSSALLSKFKNFWLDEYDWRKREKFLNKFPQYKTNIQGLNIHYLHVKPKDHVGLKVFPLLLIHGWPGSVREFYDIIPLLTTPQKGRDFVFEVVAPSLPGFGFSDSAIRPGLGVVQMGVILKNLMGRLNHDKFFVQGGDWGAIMAPHISILFPENVIGMHSNMCASIRPISILKRLLYSLYPSLIVKKEYEHLVYPLSGYFAGFLEEMGYFHIQTTKPDTIGTALSDSPSGLAAYILEKFVSWTNPNWKLLEDGGLTEKYKMEDLLDNIMIYWVTNSITTSMRIYAESYNTNKITWDLERKQVPVPAACARFAYDLEWNPEALIEDKFPKLIQVNDFNGGHFAAFEKPNVLARDIFDFVQKVASMKDEVPHH
ncbi:juvenile hormone epoxide hydrolase 1-like [Coccinella septempunctata]|uniref:juvenile hormone epoxide hydrolase 1-like n=1 Tax=Coccinella septempunctata TaxID=41139 RepID=UPI001D075A80|nr:juvenile hormone epoxide hydrolase 1-like [Coccinella septempunctata]